MDKLEVAQGITEIKYKLNNLPSGVLKITELNKMCNYLTQAREILEVPNSGGSYNSFVVTESVVDVLSTLYSTGEGTPLLTPYFISETSNKPLQSVIKILERARFIGLLDETIIHNKTSSELSGAAFSLSLKGKELIEGLEAGDYEIGVELS